MTIRFLSALLVLVLNAGNSLLFAGQVELPSIDKGRVRQDGNIGGGGPANYAAGVSAGLVHRSFFIFSVPPLNGEVITGATLRAFNPFYSSPDPTETYTLFDVDSNSTTQLLSNADPVTMSVFGDVGSGQTFGQRIVSSADNGQIVEIPLNAAGLAALNNAKGFAFAIGGSLTTLSGQTSTNEIVFGSTNSQHLVSLKLVGGSPNLPPVANAGPDQAVRAGNSVLLNGSGSFDDNTPTASLAYSWSFSSKPLGSSATLIGAATQVPTFFVDVPGTYVVRLVVTDANGLSSEADEVMISSDNLSPTAHAGNDVLVIVGELVTLNGASSTDPEFDALAFSWALTAVPPGSSATLSGATTPTPMFIPDVQGTYAVGLVVSDNLGPSLPDTVIVAATSAQNYAEVQIQDSNAIVTTLPPTSVTTAGNQNALSNFLSQATIAIQSSDLVKARAKLQQAIERTDGCALRGSPDGNGSGRDWITTCSAQIPTYQLLIDALDAIAP